MAALLGSFSSILQTHTHTRTHTHTHTQPHLPKPCPWGASHTASECVTHLTARHCMHPTSHTASECLTHLVAMHCVHPTSLTSWNLPSLDASDVGCAQRLAMKQHIRALAQILPLNRCLWCSAQCVAQTHPAKEQIPTHLCKVMPSKSAPWASRAACKKKILVMCNPCSHLVNIMPCIQTVFQTRYLIQPCLHTRSSRYTCNA